MFPFTIILHILPFLGTLISQGGWRLGYPCYKLKKNTTNLYSYILSLTHPCSLSFLITPYTHSPPHFITFITSSWHFKQINLKLICESSWSSLAQYSSCTKYCIFQSIILKIIQHIYYHHVDTWEKCLLNWMFNY